MNFLLLSAAMAMEEASSAALAALAAAFVASFATSSSSGDTAALSVAPLASTAAAFAAASAWSETARAAAASSSSFFTNRFHSSTSIEKEVLSSDSIISMVLPKASRSLTKLFSPTPLSLFDFFTSFLSIFFISPKGLFGSLSSAIFFLSTFFHFKGFLNFLKIITCVLEYSFFSSCILRAFSPKVSLILSSSTSRSTTFSCSLSFSFS